MSAIRYAMFVKTVELQSLALAAGELCCTPSAVSHGISSLEAELGVKLMQRSRAGVKLTEEGKRLYPLSQAVLSAIERVHLAANELKRGSGGTVRIGAFTSVAVHWLPGMIKSFTELYPNAEFKLLNGDYHDVNMWLESGSIDIGFVTMPDYPKNCRSVALREDRLLAVLPKDHPLAGLESFPVAAAENESFISLMENSDNDARRALEMAGVKANVKFTTKDDYAIIAMIEQGLGISIMPELLVGQTNHVRLMPLDNGASRTIGIAIPKDSEENIMVERFIEHIKDWLAKRYA